MDTTKEIEKLIEKAARQDEGHHAMHFTQAALNAANAMAVIRQINLK